MQTERLQEFCLSLPAVTKDIKWDNDLFSVGGKMFCVTSLEPPLRYSFKVSDDEFEEISNRDGIIPAPYMARPKWVTVINIFVLSKKEQDQFFRQRYELVKAKLTKKTRIELSID